MPHSIRSLDRQIARIASRQHGLITWWQLLELGLSPTGITDRVKRGLLHRVYRGVYRVGHQAPSRESRYLAAVLACGEGAVLSGAAAAVMFGLLRRDAPPEVMTTKDRQPRGVITHRVRSLDPRDVTSVQRIPVSTISRTILDLAGRLPFDDLTQLCHEAQVRYRLTAAQIEAVLARRPRTKGAKKLHAIFRGDSEVVLSELERLFLRLLKRAGLPRPRTNKKKGSYFVDCRWPGERLTVELDSYRYHHTRHAWEQDHRREREARKRGDEFRRFTYGDVTEDPEGVVEDVRGLLGGR